MDLRFLLATLACGLLAPLANAAEPSAKVHVTVFNRLDSNRDGVLSFREFGPRHHRLSSTLRTVRKAGSLATLDEIESFQRMMFAAFDSDASDSIDLLEWQILREDPLGSIPADDWRYCRILDTNHDLDVYLKEFRHFASLYLDAGAVRECFAAVLNAGPDPDLTQPYSRRITSGSVSTAEILPNEPIVVGPEGYYRSIDGVWVFFPLDPFPPLTEQP